MKITKRVVDAAKPEGERRIIWDSELKGFGLLVMPSGVKSYVYQYRTPQNVQRRITIGQHGTWTAEEARRKAGNHQETVKHGGDPLGSKRAERNAATVSDLIDAYLVSEAFTANSPATQATDRGRFERHIRPLLGKKHAHLLTEDDVRKAFRAIRDGKTATDVKTGKRGRAIVRGGHGAAREAIVRFRIAFNWALRTKFLTGVENPCNHVEVGATGSRDAILESATDYAAMFKALDRLERERRIRQPAADAIRLIALTGCRRGEAANLRWRHVERDRIVLPPREHKAGRRTGKPRIIALPAAAQAIIARQAEGEADDYVFVPAKGNGAMELSHVWEKVRAEAELPKEISLHCLRHSTASHMAMSGAEAAQIMAALGHSQLSTVQRYIHFAKDAKSALAETAAATALAGMAAATKPKSGKLVALKGGKR